VRTLGIKVCEALGVEVRLPRRHYLSFTNSPYYAHYRLSAIDVYPPRDEQEVLSPIEGRLIFHKVIGGEHVLGLESGNAYVRILHVKPYLRVGEPVSVEDPLGEAVWSPTFFKWTDPHIHLEVRKYREFAGARGCVKLTIHQDLVSYLKDCLGVCSGPREYVVDSIITGRYVILKPRPGSMPALLVTNVGNASGVMEGGIPHYGHAGMILCGRADSVNSGSDVVLNNTVIGQVDFTSGHYAHVSPLRSELNLTLNEARVYGVSFFIGASFIKVIPGSWRDLAVGEGDVASLTFRGS